MYPHRIRLRGPWWCEPLARSHADELPLPVKSRMTMPCHWHTSGLEDFTGRVRFERKFGYPGRIDNYEHVWLTLGGFSDLAEVTLNAQPLGTREGPECEFEVTAMLQARNTLEIVVDGKAETGGLWGEVALEVRRDAFLQDVTVSRVARTDQCVVRVEGILGGHSEEALELYMVVNRYNAAYKLVTPDEVGAFHLEGVVEEANPPWHVKVDLIQGSEVWYRVEKALD